MRKHVCAHSDDHAVACRLTHTPSDTHTSPEREGPGERGGGGGEREETSGGGDGKRGNLLPRQAVWHGQAAGGHAHAELRRPPAAQERAHPVPLHGISVPPGPTPTGHTPQGTRQGTRHRSHVMAHTPQVTRLGSNAMDLTRTKVTCHRSQGIPLY